MRGVVGYILYFLRSRRWNVSKLLIMNNQLRMLTTGLLLIFVFLKITIKGLATLLLTHLTWIDQKRSQTKEQLEFLPLHWSPLQCEQLKQKKKRKLREIWTKKCSKSKMLFQTELYHRTDLSFQNQKVCKLVYSNFLYVDLSNWCCFSTACFKTIALCIEILIHPTIFNLCFLVTSRQYN